MEQQLDTFDEGPYTDGPMDLSGEEAGSAEGATTDGGQEEGQEGQTSEETSVQTDEIETFDTDSQVNLLDEKEEVRGEKEEEEGEKETDKSDEDDKQSDEDPESDGVGKDSTREEDGSTEEDVRTLKAFRDGKRYEIPEDAELKVKVDGKSEKVTLTELRDNYSGKVAYDKKFSEFSEEKKTWEGQKTQYDTEIETVKEHFGNIRQLTEAGMKGEVDPASSMNYLLDLMGINTVDYNKAMFEHMAGEFDTYTEMTESEREAHWTKKENAYLVKRQESLTKRQSEEKAQVELSQKVHSLREAHSITEEDYVSAEEDLKATNQTITPEKVIQAAKLKPLLYQADDAIEPYLDQLTEDEAYDLSVDIATEMLKTPELTIEQIKTLLAEQYEVEDIMSEIEEKVGKTTTPAAKTQKRDSEHLESFDDFDY